MITRSTTHAGFRAALAILLAAVSSAPAFAVEKNPTAFGPGNAGSPADALCYLVADNDGDVNPTGGDLFVTLSSLNAVTTVGLTGTFSIEGLSFDPRTQVLYGSDGSRLVSIHLASGVATTIGSFGSGRGALGLMPFTDVDGLAFDPFSGDLYASVRRSAIGPDLLIRVDPTTGLAISDAFGPDIDYVPIGILIRNGLELEDVDDLAFDPTTGALLGVINDGGLNSILVRIDVTTGAVTDLLDLNIDSVEGLGFQGDGTLLGVVGDRNPRVVIIDLASGTVTTRSTISAGGAYDFEGIACQTQGFNHISGTVFRDRTNFGVVDAVPTDGRLVGVRVNLYRDVNSNGFADGADILLAWKLSAADGTYSFNVTAMGAFVLAVDESTVPVGLTRTTSQFQTAVFAGFGLSDAGNDFGYKSPNDGRIELRLTKTVDQTDVSIGGEIAFTLTVTNATTAIPATNVVVADLFPEGITFSDASAPLTLSGYRYTWNVGSLAPGETKSLIIRAVANRPGSHVNCAQVWSADQQDKTSVFGNGYDQGEADDACSSVLVRDPGGQALCYVIADNDNRGNSEDVFSRVVAPGLEQIIGATGTLHMEGLAFQISTGTLFGSDAGNFGRIDLATGAFTLIGAFGSGNGIFGIRTFDDVDGLSFDPFTGVLYASVRRSAAGPDLLIKVDPTTGQVIPGGFGPGVDYVAVGTVTVGSLVLDDVDDIAIDSFNGQMYGIINSSGRKSRLVLIDKADGSVTDLFDLDVENVEGLGFTADHVLLGVLGDTDRKLVVIDITTGQTTLYANLGTGGNLDYEGVACLTDARNRITGTVFFDANQDGVLNAGDSGHAGVAVMLYRDGNADGLIGHPSDVFITSILSGTNGGFVFDISSLGRFVITTNLATYPAGSFLTTTNTHTAHFTAFGQTDAGNNFGFFRQGGGQRADLKLTKTVDQHKVALNTPVTFRITVQNEGTVNMTGIMVEDLLPAGLLYQTSFASQGSYDAISGLWTVGGLVAGASATLDIQAKVTVKKEFRNVAEVFFADQIDFDSTPNNGITTEDDYGFAIVLVHSTPGFSQSVCTDMGSISALVYDPVSGQLYAGTETGVVHISNDQGKSWPPFLILGDDTPIKDIVLSGAGTVYALTFGKGAYVSTDGGTNWNPIGVNNGLFMDGFFDTVRGKLYVASRGAVLAWDGLAWSTVGGATNPFVGQQVNDVAVDLGTGKVYASSNGAGLHVYNGVSWMPANTGLPTGAMVTALHGTSTATYAGIVGGGVYKSVAGVWQAFGTGVSDQTIVTISSGPAGQLLLGTADRGAWYYDTGLSKWVEAINLPTFTVSAITAGPMGELYAGTAGQGVFTFVDGNGDGKLDTWHHVAAIVANAVIQDLVASPTGELFAATYGYGILYSIDGGNCWMRINRGLVNLYTYAIERASDGTLYIGIWADGKGGVWRSTNNGRSWQYMALGNRQIISLAIDPNNENIIYAGANLAGEGALFKSTDGGVTWQQLGGVTTPVWSVEVDPTNSDFIVVGTLGLGIFRSVNGGRTFTSFGSTSTGLGNGYVYDMQYGPAPGPYAGQLFAGTARGVYRYNSTTWQWELVGTGSEPYDVRTIAFIGSNVFAGTWAQGVLKFDPATSTWEDAGFGTLPVVAFAVVEQTQTLVVGTNGGGFFLGENLVENNATGTANEPGFEPSDLPDSFRLDAAYPNPFNPQTTIPYALDESSDVRLTVYDVLGRQVSVLVDGFQPAGDHQVVFEASAIPSGTYIVRLETSARSATRMVTLLK